MHVCTGKERTVRRYARTRRGERVSLTFLICISVLLQEMHPQRADSDQTKTRRLQSAVSSEGGRLPNGTKFSLHTQMEPPPVILKLSVVVPVLR